METIVYLSLGSNIGDREDHIIRAIDKIAACCGKLAATASLYETEPVGFISDTNFLNTCIALKTSLDPFDLLTNLRRIEKEMGRTVKSKDGVYESRIIDIDIILFGSITLENEQLTIPHPRYRSRSFVLNPLNEIAPDLIDPVVGLSIGDIYRSILDESAVSIYKKDFYANE